MLLRVLIAEDNALLREGLREVLGAADGFEVVAVTDTYPGLIRGVDEHRPDVVLTDIRMPPTHLDEGIRAARELRASHPGMGVLVLSSYEEPTYALGLLADGAEGRGYLLKDRVADVDQLLAALRQVAAGESVVDSRIVASLVSRPGGLLATLTPREREVLALMATGKNNTAIAAILVVTVRAVERHINALFAKLGLGEADSQHRRVRAVLLYLDSRP